MSSVSIYADSDSFHSQVTKKEYKINFSFNCDSLNVVYLFDCVVYGFQYVGSSSTPLGLRFNNNKACYRRFSSGFSAPQIDISRYDSEDGHHGFLEDIRVTIIDKLVGGGKDT